MDKDNAELFKDNEESSRNKAESSRDNVKLSIDTVYNVESKAKPKKCRLQIFAARITGGRFNNLYT